MSAYQAGWLDARHINDCLSLQQAVVSSLRPEEAAFLNVKTPDEMVMNLSHHQNIGIFHEDELIATARMAAGADPYMPTLENSKQADILTVEGVMVAPHHQGRGLMRGLLDVIEAKSRESGKAILAASVFWRNPASLISFLRCGYAATHGYVDGRDGASCLALHKRLEKPWTPHPTPLNVPWHNFEGIRVLLERGMIIHGWDRASSTLLAAPQAEYMKTDAKPAAGFILHPGRA